MDFRKLFQDVLPPDPNQQNINVTQTAPTPDTGLLQKIGLDNINPFFTRRDPFMTAIIGKEGADRVLGQGTGTGIVTSGLTYALTGDPVKSYLAGMEGSQKSVDKRKQSIFDMIKYSKEMKEYELMDYNALPNDYKVFGMMTKDPDFAKYQFAKDMFTNDIKEFEYSQNHKDFIKYLKEISEAKRPLTTTITNISTQNASDQLYKRLDGLEERRHTANLALPKYEVMINYLQPLDDSIGIETGLQGKLIKEFSRFAQVFDPNYNAETLAKIENFDALSKEIIIPSVKKLGVNPTNVDLKFIVDSNPELGKSKFGNIALLKINREMAEREIMLTNAVGEWEAQNIDLLTSDAPRANVMLRAFVGKTSRDIMQSRKGNLEAIQREVDEAMRKSVKVIDTTKDSTLFTDEYNKKKNQPKL